MIFVLDFSLIVISQVVDLHLQLLVLQLHLLNLIVIRGRLLRVLSLVLELLDPRLHDLVLGQHISILLL